MGLDYSKKGFSTDVYFRTKSGRLIEVSLKKDTKVMFANQVGGHVEDKGSETLEKNLPNLSGRGRKNRKRIDETFQKRKIRILQRKKRKNLKK